jgi:hypothetical protein
VATTPDSDTTIYKPASIPPKPAILDSPAKPGDFGALPKPLEHDGLGNIKLANSAEVAVELLPGQDVVPGSRVSFRVTTKKPGFLILVDVDPSGKLTQIYPNPMSLMASGGRHNSNYVRPGKPVEVPNSSDPYAGFEFIVSPPSGTGLVVAFLSDVPVQRVDIPDIPNALMGQGSALTYLSQVASELRIPQSDGVGRLQEARWSFDAKFYSIR